MIMNPRHQLSKSTFMKGCQCPKALYLNKHHRQLKDEVSDAQQAIFDRGTRVGELATQLFPNGKDASPPTPFDYPQSVALTQQLINDGTTIIYEACFQYDRVLAALDILVYREGQWHAYEVKSSTSVSETYELDAALQYYVITPTNNKSNLNLLRATLFCLFIGTFIVLLVLVLLRKDRK